MGLERDLLSTVPTWIKFPSLDLKLQSKNIVGRLASMIGTPLYMDRSTMTEKRISYARVFVEIRADKELPSKINFQIEKGEEMEVDIAYEWILLAQGSTTLSF